MTDTSKLVSEAYAISSSSSNIKRFAIDAAANIVDLANRVAAIEAAIAQAEQAGGLPLLLSHNP